MDEDRSLSRRVLRCLGCTPDVIPTIRAVMEEVCSEVGQGGDSTDERCDSLLGKPFCFEKTLPPAPGSGGASGAGEERKQMRWKVFMEGCGKTVNVPAPRRREGRVLVGNAQRAIYTMYDPLEDEEFYTDVMSMEGMKPDDINKLPWYRWLPNHPFKAYGRWVTFQGNELRDRGDRPTMYITDDRDVVRIEPRDAVAMLFPPDLEGGDDTSLVRPVASFNTTVLFVVKDENTKFALELNHLMVRRMGLSRDALTHGDLHSFLPAGLTWGLIMPDTLAKSKKDPRFITVQDMDAAGGHTEFSQHCVVDTSIRVIAMWQPVEKEWVRYAPTFPSTVTLFLGQQAHPWTREGVRWKKTPRYTIPVWRDPLTKGLYELSFTSNYDVADAQFRGRSLEESEGMDEAEPDWETLPVPRDQDNYLKGKPWAVRIRRICAWAIAVDAVAMAQQDWSSSTKSVVLSKERVDRMTATLFDFIRLGFGTIHKALCITWPSRFTDGYVATLHGSDAYKRHCSHMAEQLRIFGEDMHDAFGNLHTFERGIVSEPGLDGVRVVDAVDKTGFFEWKHVEEEMPVWRAPDRWVIPAVHNEDVVSDAQGKAKSVVTERVLEEIDVTPLKPKAKGWDLAPRVWYTGTRRDRYAWLDWVNWRKFVYTYESRMWERVRTEAEFDRHNYVQFSDWMDQHDQARGIMNEVLRRGIDERNQRYTRKVAIRGTGFVGPDINAVVPNMSKHAPGTVFWPVGEDLARTFFGMRVSMGVFLDRNEMEDTRRGHALSVLTAQRYVEEQTRVEMMGGRLENGPMGGLALGRSPPISGQWHADAGMHLGVRPRGGNDGEGRNGRDGRFDKSDNDDYKMRRGKESRDVIVVDDGSDAKASGGAGSEREGPARECAVELKNPAQWDDNAFKQVFDTIDCSWVNTGVSAVNCVLNMLCLMRAEEEHKVGGTPAAAFFPRWETLLDAFAMQWFQRGHRAHTAQVGFMELLEFFLEGLDKNVFMDNRGYAAHVKRSVEGRELVERDRENVAIVRPTWEILEVLCYRLGVCIRVFGLVGEKDDVEAHAVDGGSGAADEAWGMDAPLVPWPGVSPIGAGLGVDPSQDLNVDDGGESVEMLNLRLRMVLTPKDLDRFNSLMPPAMAFTDDQLVFFSRAHGLTTVNLLFPDPQKGGSCRLLVPLQFLKKMALRTASMQVGAVRQPVDQDGLDVVGNWNDAEQPVAVTRETQVRVMGNNDIFFDMFLLSQQRLGNYSFFGCVRDAAAACLGLEPGVVPSVFMMMRDWFQSLCTPNAERNRRLVENGVPLALDGEGKGLVNARIGSSEAIQNAVQNIALRLMGPLADGMPLVMEKEWFLALAVMGIPRRAVDMSYKAGDTWHPLCFYLCKEVGNRLARYADSPIESKQGPWMKEAGQTVRVPIVVMSAYGLDMRSKGVIGSRPVEAVTYHLLCADQPLTHVEPLPSASREGKRDTSKGGREPARGVKRDDDEDIEEIFMGARLGVPTGRGRGGAGRGGVPGSAGRGRGRGADRGGILPAAPSFPVRGGEESSTPVVPSHIDTLSLISQARAATENHMMDMGNASSDTVLAATITVNRIMQPTARETAKAAVTDTNGFPPFAYFVRGDVCDRRLYLDTFPSHVLRTYKPDARNMTKLSLCMDVYALDTLDCRFRFSDVLEPYEQAYHRLDTTVFDPMRRLVLTNPSFAPPVVPRVEVSTLREHTDVVKGCVAELRGQWQALKGRTLADVLALARGLKASQAPALGVPPGGDPDGGTAPVEEPAGAGGVLPTDPSWARAVPSVSWASGPVKEGMEPFKLSGGSGDESGVPVISVKRGMRNVVVVDPGSDYNLAPPTDHVINLFVRNVCFQPVAWTMTRVSHIWSRSFDKVSDDDESGGSGTVQEPPEESYGEGGRRSGISWGRFKQSLLQGIEVRHSMSGLSGRESVLTFQVLQALAGVYDSTNESLATVSVLDRPQSYPNFILLRACGDAFGQAEVVLHSDVRGLALAWHLLRHPELTPAFVPPVGRWRKEDHEHNIASMRRDMLCQVAIILQDGASFRLLKGGSVVPRVTAAVPEHGILAQPLRAALSELHGGYLRAMAGFTGFSKSLPARPRLKNAVGSGSDKRFTVVSSSTLAIDTEVDFRDAGPADDHWRYDAEAYKIRREFESVQDPKERLSALKSAMDDFATEKRIRMVLFVRGVDDDRSSSVTPMILSGQSDARTSRLSTGGVRGRSTDTSERIKELVQRLKGGSTGMQSLIRADDYKSLVTDHGFVSYDKFLHHETVYLYYRPLEKTLLHIAPVKRLGQYATLDEALKDVERFRVFFVEMQKGIEFCLGVISAFSLILKCLSVVPETIGIRADVRLTFKGKAVSRPLALPTTLEADVWRQHYESFFVPMDHHFNPSDREFPMVQYDEYAENLVIFYYYASSCCRSIRNAMTKEIQPYLRSISSLMVQRSLDQRVQGVLREAMAVSTLGAIISCHEALGGAALLRAQEEIFEKFFDSSAGVKSVVQVIMQDGVPSGFSRFVQVMRSPNYRLTYVDEERKKTLVWDPLLKETREVHPFMPFIVLREGKRAPELGDLCVASSVAEYKEVSKKIQSLRQSPNQSFFAERMKELLEKQRSLVLRISPDTQIQRYDGMAQHAYVTRGTFVEFLHKTEGEPHLLVQARDLRWEIQKLQQTLDELKLIIPLMREKGADIAPAYAMSVNQRIQNMANMILAKDNQLAALLAQRVMPQHMGTMMRGQVEFNSETEVYTWVCPSDGFVYTIGATDFPRLETEPPEMLWKVVHGTPSWDPVTKKWSDDSVMYDTVMLRYVWRNASIRWHECKDPNVDPTWSPLGQGVFPGLFFEVHWDTRVDDVFNFVSARCCIDVGDISGPPRQMLLRKCAFVVADDGVTTYKTIPIAIGCTKRGVWKEHGRGFDEDELTPWARHERTSAFEAREYDRVHGRWRNNGPQKPHWSETAAEKSKAQSSDSLLVVRDSNYAGMRCLESYNGYCNCISTDFGTIEMRGFPAINPFTEWRQGWFLLSTNSTGEAGVKMKHLSRTKLNADMLKWDTRGVLEEPTLFITNAEGFRSYRYDEEASGNEVFWAHDMLPEFDTSSIDVDSSFTGPLKRGETLVQGFKNTFSLISDAPCFQKTIGERVSHLSAWVMDPINWFWDHEEGRFVVFLFGPDVVTLSFPAFEGGRSFLVQEMIMYYVDQFVPDSGPFHVRYYEYLKRFTRFRQESKENWAKIEKIEPFNVSAKLRQTILLSLRGSPKTSGVSSAAMLGVDPEAEEQPAVEDEGGGDGDDGGGEWSTIPRHRAGGASQAPRAPPPPPVRPAAPSRFVDNSAWVPHVPSDGDLAELDMIHDSWLKKYVQDFPKAAYYVGNGDFLRERLDIKKTGDLTAAMVLAARAKRQMHVRELFLRLFLTKFGIGFGMYMNDEGVRRGVDAMCPGFLGPCRNYRRAKRSGVSMMQEFYRGWAQDREQGGVLYSHYCARYFNWTSMPEPTDTPADHPELVEYISRVSINTQRVQVSRRFQLMGPMPPPVGSTLSELTRHLIDEMEHAGDSVLRVSLGEPDDVRAVLVGALASLHFAHVRLLSVTGTPNRHLALLVRGVDADPLGYQRIMGVVAQEEELRGLSESLEKRLVYRLEQMRGAWDAFVTRCGQQDAALGGILVGHAFGLVPHIDRALAPPMLVRRCGRVLDGRACAALRRNLKFAAGAEAYNLVAAHLALPPP